MAITQRGSATTATDGDVAFSGTLVCNKPTGVVSGDVIVAYITSNDRDVTCPGFTTIVDEVASGSTVFRLQVLYRVANGSEGSTFTFTIGSGSATSPMVIGITAWDGANTTTPFGASNHAETSATSNASEPLTGPAVSSNDAETGRTFYARASRFSNPGVEVTNTFSASSVTEQFDTRIFSGGSVTYSQAMYSATSDFTGNGSRSGLAITASQTETTNISSTLVLTGAAVTHSADAERSVTNTRTVALGGTAKPVAATRSVTATLASALGATAKPVATTRDVTASTASALAGTTKPVHATQDVTVTLASALGETVKPVAVTSPVTATTAADLTSVMDTSASRPVTVAVTATPGGVAKPVASTQTTTVAGVAALAGSTKSIDVDMT